MTFRGPIWVPKVSFWGFWGWFWSIKVLPEFWFGHPKCHFWYPQNDQKGSKRHLRNPNRTSKSHFWPFCVFWIFLLNFLWVFFEHGPNFSNAKPLIEINFFWANFFFLAFLCTDPVGSGVFFWSDHFWIWGPALIRTPPEKHQSACKGRCQKPQSRSILIIGKPSEFFLGKTRDFVPTGLTQFCRRVRKFMD